MNDSGYPLLREVAPRLIATLERLLNEAGESDLASQVAGLPVAERNGDKRGCDYYMVAKPNGPWGAGHRTLSLMPGALHVDVVGNKIFCVEILRGPLNFSPDLEVS